VVVWWCVGGGVEVKNRASVRRVWCGREGDDKQTEAAATVRGSDLHYEHYGRPNRHAEPYESHCAVATLQLSVSGWIFSGAAVARLQLSVSVWIFSGAAVARLQLSVSVWIFRGAAVARLQLSVSVWIFRGAAVARLQLSVSVWIFRGAAVARLQLSVSVWIFRGAAVARLQLSVSVWIFSGAAVARLQLSASVWIFSGAAVARLQLSVSVWIFSGAAVARLQLSVSVWIFRGAAVARLQLSVSVWIFRGAAVARLQLSVSVWIFRGAAVARLQLSVSVWIFRGAAVARLRSGYSVEQRWLVSSYRYRCGYSEEQRWLVFSSLLVLPQPPAPARRTNLHLSLVWALVTMDSLGALGASLVELTRGEKHHAWDSAAAARQLQQHSGSDLGSDHNAIADVRAALDDLVRDSSNSGARAIKARAFLGAIQDVLAQQYGVPLRDMEVADEHHADEHDDDTPLPPASAYFAAAMSLLESLAADDDHHQDTRDHDAMAHDRSEHEGAGSVESASDDDAAGIVYLVSRIVPLLAASLLRRRLLPITRALTRLTHRFFHNEQVVQAVRSPTLPSIHTAGWQLTLVSWPVARASTRSERSRAPLSHASNNNELLLLQRRRLVVRYRRHRQHRERLTGRRYLA